MPPTPIDERLRLLHEHYTWQINAAVADGRMDLVRELANDCQDEALALILAAEGETSSWPNQQNGRNAGVRRLAALARRPQAWRVGVTVPAEQQPLGPDRPPRPLPFNDHVSAPTLHGASP